MPESGRGAAFAAAGEYYVCSPAPGDEPRLRELEREFVQDHSDMFCQEPWHGRLDPIDWYRLVSVIDDDARAEKAIVGIVTGKIAGHVTLQCMHAPGGNTVPTIVGYVHVTHAGGLDISHLKVDSRHRGRGLGALLVAGAGRCVEALGWQAETAQLVVLGRNAPAIALYRALGFCSIESLRKPIVADGVSSAEWRKMVRPLTGLSLGGFVDLCEARANATWQRAVRTPMTMGGA